MCLIIDNDVAHKVFTSTGEDTDSDFECIADCLFGRRKPRAEMVCGGELTDEYLSNSRMRKVLVELDRSGRIESIPDKKIREEKKDIGESCVSNDEHIIAIARISGARILCSHDQDLHSDFRNPELISNPRGNIYQDSSHEHLLRIHCG